MPDRKHENIFWIDLETTGSDLEGHDIIEVGAAITGIDLDVRQMYSAVLPLGQKKYDIKPIVKDMHTRNGLWSDVHKSRRALEEVDSALEAMVKRWSPDGHHLPFAGSGVAHFDRQFIKRDLPKLNKLITYWPLDVGVLRRTFLMFTDIPWIAPQSDKTHRALDDVLFHIKEMRYAVDTINGL